MGPFSVVVVDPGLEVSISFQRVGPVFCVCPFAQGGLDEAFGLPIGSWRVRAGVAVLICICWQAWRNWCER